MTHTHCPYVFDCLHDRNFSHCTFCDFIDSSYGGKERATAMSLYSFFLFVGSTIGPIITIYLLKVTGYGWTFIILSMFLGTGISITFLIAKKVFQRAG
ncbi:MFS transporter [Alteribacillus sp. YIM 98480]|uniref:MFS transporter n=1 Tax=Alteribacillus sp. YIM 98480 TaxID=2606599 RepID=UPI00351B636F